MITLDQARSAKRQLEDLQAAAAILPQLERREAKQKSQKHIESLRAQTQKTFGKEYENYTLQCASFKTAFENAVAAMRIAANELSNLLRSRRKLQSIVNEYLVKAIRHDVRFENIDRFSSEIARLDNLRLQRYDHDLAPRGAFYSQLYQNITRMMGVADKDLGKII